MASIAFDVPLHQSHLLSTAEIQGYKDRIRKLLIEQDGCIGSALLHG